MKLQLSRLRSRVPTGVAIAALVGLIALSGCVPAMKFGSPPKTQQLAGLKLGVSTKSEVLAALGEPRGRGVSRETPDQKDRRDILFYEYITVDSPNIGTNILLVMMNGDLYDGYLWFASSSLVEVTQ